VKTLLTHPWLNLLTRTVVGSIFIFSSVEKTADPGAFAVLLDNYRLLPYDFSLAVATVLPWVELVCGMAVLAGIAHRGASLILGVLTIGFTVAVVSGLLRGLDISCGCYTLDPEVGKIGWSKVVENTELILLFVFLVYSTGTRWTFDRMLDRSTVPEEHIS